jgi:hypothetical protein
MRDGLNDNLLLLILLFWNARPQVVSRICRVCYYPAIAKHFSISTIVFVFETAVPHTAFIGSPRGAR